jgi:hypothetical protein
MGTRHRWIVAAGTAALAAIIIGTAIAQAVRQHSLDPIWMVGWLPAVLVAVYPAATGRGRRARRACLGRLRRPAGAGPAGAGPAGAR